MGQRVCFLRWRRSDVEAGGGWGDCPRSSAHRPPSMKAWPLLTVRTPPQPLRRVHSVRDPALCGASFSARKFARMAAARRTARRRRPQMRLLLENIPQVKIRGRNLCGPERTLKFPPGLLRPEDPAPWPRLSVLQRCRRQRILTQDPVHQGSPRVSGARAPGRCGRGCCLPRCSWPPPAGQARSCQTASFSCDTHHFPRSAGRPPGGSSLDCNERRMLPRRWRRGRRRERAHGGGQRARGGETVPRRGRRTSTSPFVSSGASTATSP